MADARFAIVGRVRGAHGIHGELVVEPITDAPEAFFGPGRRIFAGDASAQPRVARETGAAETAEITGVRPFKAGMLVTIAGVADRTSAEAWRGRYLLVPFAELPAPAEGQVYLHDLPGMRVELPDGTDLGPIREVYELPQGLVVEVARGTGSVLLPYTERTLRAADRERGVVVLELPEGLLE